MNRTNTRNLTKGSLIYSIGNIGTIVINFFLVPLYTFYLSKDELGYFDILASSIIVLAPVFFGHIELAILRWALADKEDINLKRVVSNSLAVFLMGVALFTIAYLILRTFFYWHLWQYVLIYFIANFFYVIVKQLIRSVYSSRHYVITEIIYTLMVLVGMLLLVTRLGLKGIFVSYGIASALLLGYLLALRIGRYISLSRINTMVIKELLGYSAPLIPNTFSLWLNNMSAKYFILLYLGLAANGIFAIAFKIAYVLQILNRIFYMSFQDQMFTIYGSEGHQEYFTQVFRRYSKIIFSLLYFLIAFQKPLLPYIIDEAFLEASRYIPILGFGVLFMSLSNILGIIYQCEKKNISASKTSAVSGLLIVIGCLLFTSNFGLYGVSVVFMAGNLALFIYRDLDTMKYNPDKTDYVQQILMIAGGLIIWVLTSLNKDWAPALAIVFSILLAGLLNREILATYFRGLKGILQNSGNSGRQ